jgi:hypothetical protein
MLQTSVALEKDNGATVGVRRRTFRASIVLVMRLEQTISSSERGRWTILPKILTDPTFCKAEYEFATG